MRWSYNRFFGHDVGYDVFWVFLGRLRGFCIGIWVDGRLYGWKDEMVFRGCLERFRVVLKGGLGILEDYSI
jgi:hypothetical protein